MDDVDIEGKKIEPEKPDAKAAAAEPAPKIQPIRSPFKLTALAVIGLFVLAFFYTLYFAREFFIPLTMAWLLNLLLKPIVRWMTRFHINEPLGAGIVILGIVGMLIAGAVLVSEPASSWLSKAPETMETAGQRVRSMLRPAEKFQKAAVQVEKISNAGGEEEEPTQKVEIKKPGLFSSLVTKTTNLLFLICEMVVLLYFFLAAGDVLMLKTIQILPRLTDKKRALEIAREMEQQISRYLGSVSIVNAIEGTVIGIGLWLAGMPNPVLWGVMAAFVNFVPYIGALVTIGCITVVSLVTFDTIGQALIPPAIYLAVNVSDNFISPIFLGKRLVLNPLVVFVALMFWGWIWGIMGVLLAIPITMAFKVFCDHFQSLAPLGELLTGEPAKPEA